MQWRLARHPYGGWQKVNGARHYQWEPPLPAVFSTKKEAAAEMAKLIANYS